MMTNNFSNLLTSNQSKLVQVDYLICEMSQESACQIRRIIHKAGKDFSENEIEEKKSYLEETIKDFLKEEFDFLALEMFINKVEWFTDFDIFSWEYPGKWLAEINDHVNETLKERKAHFISSNNGNYSIRISKYSQDRLGESSLW